MSEDNTMPKKVLQHLHLISVNDLKVMANIIEVVKILVLTSKKWQVGTFIIY